MLQLGTNSCSLGFVVMQSLVGGFLGSLGFIVNMLIVGGAFKAYQRYKTHRADTSNKGPIYAGNIPAK